MMAIKISSLPGVLRDVATSLYFLLITLSADAQQTKQLSINDTLPTLSVRDLVRPLISPFTTKEFYSDGMLIISFWATWCKPCIKEMQLLTKEIAHHQGKLSIICVSYEPKATVEAFLDKHPDIKNSGLIVTSDDKVFKKMFFHQALPHNVWINQKGIIKAITGTEEVSPINIQNFLQNSDNAWRVKKEKRFNSNKIASIPDSVFRYRSIFSRELPGVEMSGSSVPIGKLGKASLNRYFAYNNLITHMIWIAHQMPGTTPNRYLMEVHTTDSSRFFWPGEGKDPATYQGQSRDEWGRSNQYTYEFRSPKLLPDEVFFSKIISDLELYFELKTHKELRKRMCRIITNDTRSGVIKAAADSAKYYLGMDKSRFVISNVPFEYFMSMIPLFTFPTLKKEPYVNQTNIKGNISASFDLGNDPKKYTDIDHWEKCMIEQLGLKIQLKETLYPILTINDN